MSGQLLIGMYIGGLLSSVALHWLYQRSAAKDEKRWRAEVERCRDEICRLHLTDAERTLIEKLTWPHPDPRMGRPLLVSPDERDIAAALLAQLEVSK